MNSIFEENGYNNLLKRLDSLNESAPRQWGKMSVGQMAWHCKQPLKYGIDNKMPLKKGNPLIRWFFKKAMYSDNPIIKNLPTSPQLRAKIDKDFSIERDELRKLITDFHQLKERKQWNPHPLFGDFTHEQWGKMQYKHLNHHLNQFGV